MVIWLVVRWNRILGIIQEMIGLLILMELELQLIGIIKIGLGLINSIGMGLRSVWIRKMELVLLQGARISISKR